MFCDNCGVKMENYSRFCPACGKSAGAVPFMPTQGRIAGHLRLLGIFWLAVSALSVIPAFVLLTFFRPASMTSLGCPTLSTILCSLSA